MMKKIVKEYVNADILVRFDPRVCIHSGNCLRGLPVVFDLRKRPWVNVDAAATALAHH